MFMLLPTLTLLLQSQPAPSLRIEEALKVGSLSWQFSGPDEVKAVLGPPQREERIPDGGMELLLWHYPSQLLVVLGRQSGTQSTHGLLCYQVGKERIGPSAASPLVMRSAGDLAKLLPFSGLQGVDASRVDLREEGVRLRALSFDSLTRWPPPDRLPKGFNPQAILEDGRNPGLGLRGLHAQGLDARGMDLAIIDQPLLANHQEVEGRLDSVMELDVEGVPPQMHGPAVSSLAAGATCGVAPRARIHYVTMAMWKSQVGNSSYIKALERILELNRSQKTHIRTVSISYGAFSAAPQADAWKSLLARAESSGLLVISCDMEATGLIYGLLKPVVGGDRDKPEGYVLGTYPGQLLVPGDGRTFASPKGPSVFVFGPQGGLSWGAPWLAGLATLGFQANPELTPARVRTYLMQSATPMPYGRVVNPAAFIALCRTDPENPVRRNP